MRIELDSSFPDEAMETAVRKVAANASKLKWPADLEVCMPHRVYFLRYRGLLSRRPMREAVEAGGWRFLVRKKDAPQITAAVLTWDDGFDWRVSSIQKGTWATQTRTALEKADSALQNSATVTYLWCRTTWTAALWFRADNADDDQVVPLSAVSPDLPALEAQRAAHFLQAVRRRAQGPLAA